MMDDEQNLYIDAMKWPEWLTMGGIAVDAEINRLIVGVERYLAKVAAYQEWCREHGIGI